METDEIQKLREKYGVQPAVAPASSLVQRSTLSSKWKLGDDGKTGFGETLKMAGQDVKNAFSALPGKIKQSGEDVISEIEKVGPDSTPLETIGRVVKGGIKGAARIAGDVIGAAGSPAGAVMGIGQRALSETLPGVAETLSNSYENITEAGSRLPGVEEFVTKHPNAPEDVERALNIAGAVVGAPETIAQGKAVVGAIKNSPITKAVKKTAKAVGETITKPMDELEMPQIRKKTTAQESALKTKEYLKDTITQTMGGRKKLGKSERVTPETQENFDAIDTLIDDIASNSDNPADYIPEVKDKKLHWKKVQNSLEADNATYGEKLGEVLQTYDEIPESHIPLETIKSKIQLSKGSANKQRVLNEYIQQRFDEYAQTYGDGPLTPLEQQTLKSELYETAYAPGDNIRKEADRLVARALRDSMLENVDSEVVKGLLSAQEKRHQVLNLIKDSRLDYAVDGGRLTQALQKTAAQAVGGGVGSVSGGPVGAIVGTIVGGETADAIARYLVDKKIDRISKQFVTKELEKNAPDLLEKANDLIDNNFETIKARDADFEKKIAQMKQEAAASRKPGGKNTGALSPQIKSMLSKEVLKKYHTQDIEDLILYTDMFAGKTAREIDKIYKNLDMLTRQRLDGVEKHLLERIGVDMSKSMSERAYQIGEILEGKRPLKGGTAYPGSADKNK